MKRVEGEGEIDSHEQGEGSEVEQLGHELTSIWNASAKGVRTLQQPSASSLTHLPAVEHPGRQQTMA